MPDASISFNALVLKKINEKNPPFLFKYDLYKI